MSGLDLLALTPIDWGDAPFFRRIEEQFPLDGPWNDLLTWDWLVGVDL